QLLGRHLAAHESVLLGSGREAIELLRKDSDFDVLVCDVQLGDCTGMQVHAEVEKVDPRLSERMVFITGGAFTPASESFLDQPGRHVITKPFRGPDLCRAVTVAAVE
ncbi:MAG: response regulator, partial [Pseudomonadota bacterium]